MMTAMDKPKPRVLIAGAGIAGPAAAYWLVKAGCSVTVVERSKEIRTAGQSIDVRNDGVRVIREMGIEQTVKDASTSEEGLQFVDDNGRPFGTFGRTGDVERQSFTSEFEVLRGELAKIMYDVTKDKAEYVLGEYVKAIDQDYNTGKVTVEFVNGKAQERFDLVVAADGLNSKTRAIAYDTPVREYLRSLNAHFSYFTIGKDLLEGSKYAKIYHMPGGRIIMLRPDPKGDRVRANVGLVGSTGGPDITGVFREAEQDGDTARLKQIFADLVRDGGWLSKQVVDGMMQSDDFYSSEVAQIYIPSLHKGRVTLVGDAACAPSPVTGSGTTLSYTTAYILAGEINNSIKKGEDLTRALERYDREMLPRARKTQSLPPGVPGIANPKTAWGLVVFRTIIWLVSSSGLLDVIGRLAGIVSFGKGAGLPDYDWNA